MSVEFAKLTSKGQVTIPVAVRKALGLKQGDKLVFVQDGNGFRIINAATLNFDTQGGAAAPQR